MIYVLFYSGGSYEDYYEINLFSSEDKDFIKSKVESYEEQIDYLYERALKNSKKSRKFDAKFYFSLYCKILGYPFNGYVGFGFNSIKTYDEFAKDNKCQVW